jgi:hypothetical protein
MRSTNSSTSAQKNSRKGKKEEKGTRKRIRIREGKNEEERKKKKWGQIDSTNHTHKPRFFYSPFAFLTTKSKDRGGGGGDIDKSDDELSPLPPLPCVALVSNELLPPPLLLPASRRVDVAREE